MLGIQRARFTLMFSYVVSQGYLFLGEPSNFIYRTRRCFSSLSTLATGEGHDSILYKAVCLQQSSIKPFLWTKCWLRLTASVRKQQRKINCSQAKCMGCYPLSWLLHRDAFCQNLCPCGASFDMWDSLPPLPFFFVSVIKDDPCLWGTHGLVDRQMASKEQLWVSTV